jgi:hypothetical protein
VFKKLQNYSNPEPTPVPSPLKEGVSKVTPCHAELVSASDFCLKLHAEIPKQVRNDSFRGVQRITLVMLNLFQHLASV